jgi:thiamine biosynthesis lipoprotein
MGSDAQVIVEGDPWLLVRARARIEELEARWSRFRPTSEVSRLNAAAGHPVAVSRDTEVLLRRSVDGIAVTAGLFDPTVLPDVLAAGYDRPFDQLPPTRSRCSSARSAGAGAPRTAGSIEVGDGFARLVDGLGFDPGAIGKGLAADLVAAELLSAGARGALVNIGGDLRALGRAPIGGWRVGLDDGRTIRIAEGGVATSGTGRRRWTVGGAERHHVIDPRTGEPAEVDGQPVTVLAAEAWQAEVLATALLLDPTAGRALIAQLGASTPDTWGAAA